MTVLSNSPGNALGAPLFGPDGHFAGIVVEPQGERHRAAFVFDFIRLLRERFSAMDDDDQNFAAELARTLNFELGGSEIAVSSKHRDFSENPTAQPTVVEPGAVFDSPSPVAEAVKYSLRAYALTSTASGTVLLTHGKDDYQLTSERLELAVFPGFTLTAMNEGIIIAGGRNTAQRSSYLWNASGLNQLPDMPSSHSYHCAASVIGTLLVVSGEVTAEVSGYDSTTRNWQKQPAVPTQRAQASATAHSRSLYVVGGITQSGTRTDEILQFILDTRRWVTLPCRLSFPCANAGAKIVNGEELLVFGGTSADKKQVDRVHILHLASGRVLYEGRLPEAAAFGESGVTDEPDFIVFSTEQRLFMYREAKKEFVLVALPPQ